MNDQPFGLVEKPGEYRGYAYITRRCDLRCWYCNVPLVDAAKSGELSPDRWRVILQNFHALGGTLLTFGGGEPFLRQDILLGAVPYAIQLGVYPVLLTDGRLVATNPKAQQTLRTLKMLGLNCLSVSIDNATDLDELPDTDEGSRLKTYYGYQALHIARDMGLTDLGATAVLDTADPHPTIEVVKRLGGEGIDVRISLVQAMDDQVTINAFQKAYRPESSNHPELPQVAQWLRDNAEQYRVRNTPGYFDGIVDGSYRDWACQEPGYIVIAPDGRLQLCQNVYGVNLRRGTNLADPSLGDRIDQAKQDYQTQWKLDLEQYCPGCYINCNVDFENRRQTT